MTCLAEQGHSLLAERADRVVSLPEEVDWRGISAVKNVQDQGACGSCWAVATASMLQAHYEIHMKDNRTFSAQELVNCVPNPKECGGSGGCNGATVELAMKFVQENGLADSSTVPYFGSDGVCKNKPASLAERAKVSGVSGSGLVGLTSWRTLPSNKAQPLMEALQKGPVAISAGASPWASYESGIFNGCNKDAIIDHAIVMVGYGVDQGTKYWTVQNSWSTGWGENGFIRLLRHSVQEDDEFCGTDTRPGDGIACKPYPDSVTVCGMCGILYDSVAPTFALPALQQSQSFLARK